MTTPPQPPWWRRAGPIVGTAVLTAILTTASTVLITDRQIHGESANERSDFLRQHRQVIYAQLLTDEGEALVAGGLVQHAIYVTGLASDARTQIRKQFAAMNKVIMDQAQIALQGTDKASHGAADIMTATQDFYAVCVDMYNYMAERNWKNDYPPKEQFEAYKKASEKLQTTEGWFIYAARPDIGGDD